jgi:hypothetical protein
VDSYIGPPDFAAEADARALDAGALAAEARRVRESAASDPDAQRVRWLDRQLVALETLARGAARDHLAYIDEVERCFDARPVATSPAVYADARRELDELLPPGASLVERLDTRGQRLTIPKDRLPAVAEWLIGQLRKDSDAVFASPAGESLEVSLVTNQPWSAYNWYDGDLRSRVEINTDLPVRAHSLIHTLAHETFPGHHLEHSWKEQRLVRELDRAEATAMLVNTPEAYISEGLGDLGWQLIITPQRWQELFAGVCDLAGITLDPGDPLLQWRISEALEGVGAIGADAALMLHAEGRPPEEVLDFIVESAPRTRAQAEKTLEFISHPLWRTYVFCYSGGEALLKQWMATATDLPARRALFYRLLTEQLTPSGIAEEIDRNSGNSRTN